MLCSMLRLIRNRSVQLQTLRNLCISVGRKDTLNQQLAKNEHQWLKSRFSTDQEMHAYNYFKELFDLSGSVAFITGCSRGIGRETCFALARAGSNILVTDSSINKLAECDKIVKDIKDMGRNAASAVVDVRYLDSVKQAVKKCQTELGSIDILVANAGILGTMKDPEEMDETDWRNVFATNVDGVLHCCRAVYPIMKKNKKGKVVIISSITSMTGYQSQAAFSSSKGAVIPLAKSLAVSWAGHNIQVNCVLPGMVNTEFVNPVLEDDNNRRYQVAQSIPAGRMAEPRDIVGPILFFCSRASDYCTGSQLVVDGGISSNIFNP